MPQERSSLGGILVVEDEQIVAHDLVATLIALGYSVLPAVSSGEEAIRKATELLPDLILMDVRLAGQIDGVQASEVIRRSRDIPIIYLTAHADSETLRRATATTPFGYLVKPFRAPDLRCAIEIALHRHQIEDRLRKREQWFATTLRSVGDAVVATDADQRVTFLNPIAEWLTGWTLDDARGHALDQILHLVAQQTRSPIESPARRALLQKRATTLQSEAMLVSRAGNTIPVEGHAAPILHEGGEVLGTVTVIRDITERKRAGDALRRQSDYLASLHETALAVMDRLDLEPLLEALVGRAASLVGAPDGFLYLEARDASVLQCRVWLGAQPVDSVVGPNEGAVGVVWQNGQPMAIEDYDAWPGRLPEVPFGIFGSMAVVPLRLGGRVAGALGLAHDRSTGLRFGETEVHLLTSYAQLASIALENARLFEQERDARAGAERELVEREQAQQQLQRSEERFRQLAENIDAVFWMRALSGEMLYLSPAFERVWGRSVEEPMRHPERFASWLHPQDQARVTAHMATTPEAAFEMEYRIVRPDGKVRWIHTRGFPVHEPNGSVGRFAGVSEDVTEMKAAEALREDLRRTMVHDLRNPLTVVRGFVDVLQSPAATPDVQRTMGRAAGRSVDKLLRLISSILDVSRLESGALPLDRRRVSLASLVAEVIDIEAILADERELRLVNEVADDLPHAWADADLVGRILQNLIGNAIKFTPRGGVVRVAGCVEARDGPTLRVSVVDNGPGIPPDVRVRLFEAFATGGQEGRGSGLGLAFCRLAVEAHGGRIWVEDGREVGAAFHFTLPMAASENQRLDRP